MKSKVLIFGSLTALLFFGFFLRAYLLEHSFLTCETNNIFFGLKAHGLRWITPRGTPYVKNFFHFFFSTIAGFRFILSGYLFSPVLKLLNIPLDETGLVLPYVFLSTACIYLVYRLGAILGSQATGLFAGLLFAINQGVVHSSRWDNAEPTVTFCLLLSIYLLFKYKKDANPVTGFILSVVLSITASMESIMALPLIVLIQFCLSDGAPFKQRVRTFLLSLKTYYIWVPTAILLCIHLYYYYQPYGLGLFGYMTHGYHERLTIHTVVSRTIFVYNHYADYYFGHLFFTASVLLWIVLFKRGAEKFYALFFGYFFVSFIYLTGTLKRAEHLYICDPLNMLFLACPWVLLVSKRRALSWMLCGVLVLFFASYTGSQVQGALNRKKFIHPFKAIGYFVRTHGDKQSTVFNLFGCDAGVCQSHLAEYYYGKQLLHSMEGGKYPRQLFCTGSASPKEIVKAYGLEEATFYIDLKNVVYMDKEGKLTSYSHPEIYTHPENSKIAKKLGANKVATVYFRDLELADIYSSKPIPFLRLEVTEYNKLWADRYGYLGEIIPKDSPWIGLVSIFGEGFNTAVGK